MILAIYLVPRGMAEVLQFGKTIAEYTGMSGYQKHEAVSAYRFGPTSVRRFRDIMIAADTSSYAVWSENNHTNTNITLETMNDLKVRRSGKICSWAMTDVKKGGNRVDILINSDRIKECE